MTRSYTGVPRSRSGKSPGASCWATAPPGLLRQPLSGFLSLRMRFARCLPLDACLPQVSRTLVGFIRVVRLRLLRMFSRGTGVPQCTVYLLTVVGADFSFWQLRSKLVYTLVKVFVWMCIFIFLSDYPDTEYLVQRTGICPV